MKHFFLSVRHPYWGWMPALTADALRGLAIAEVYIFGEPRTQQDLDLLTAAEPLMQPLPPQFIHKIP